MRINVTEEQKKQIVDYIMSGLNTQQIADVFRVSRASMTRIISQIDVAELVKDRKTVNCTPEVCAMCYYGGKMCNYLLVNGHSRTIAGKHFDGKGHIVAEIKNPVRACGEFVYSKTKAIEFEQVNMM